MDIVSEDKGRWEGCVFIYQDFLSVIYLIDT